MPDETDQIKAIEHILSAYKYQSVGEEKLLIRTLHELFKSQFDNEMSSDALQTVRMLLRYVETVLTKYLTRSWEDLLEAVNYLLEKVAQAVSFPVKLLADLYYTQGEVNRLLRRYQQALSALNRAIELDEENAEPVIARVRTYLSMGRYNDALADLDRAIELDPNYTHVGQKEKGLIFYSQRRYEEAIDALIKAIAAHPPCEGCWTLLARMYGDFYSTDLIPRLLREVSIPKVSEALVNAYRAIALKNTGYYEEALSDITQAIEIRPKTAWIIFQRSQIYKELRRYEEALSDMTQAHKLDNSLIKDWWNEQGLMLSDLGRYDEAINSYEQSLKEYPSNYSTLYNIAVAKTRANLQNAQTSISAAFSVFQELVKNNTEQGSAYYGLGGLEALVGHTSEALDYLERSISLEKQAINWAKHDMA